MIRNLILSFSLLFSFGAQAKEASPAAAGVVASDQPGYIRVLGRLNVNTASRAQLELVPGLDSSKIDALLQVRPIRDLEKLELPEDALVHLKLDGDSNLYRVRQNPLRRVDPSPASAAR
jgi:hypothetical protein